MRESLIRQEATLIRHALEKIAHKLEGLQSFPRGACGNASVLLGEWLIRKGFKDVEYVSGSSVEIKSHAWLECDGLIIDITADQFDLGMPPVFVGGFDRQCPTDYACAVAADAPCLPARGQELLRESYGLSLGEGAPQMDCSNFYACFEIQSRHPCVMDGAYDRANYVALERVILSTR